MPGLVAVAVGHNPVVAPTEKRLRTGRRAPKAIVGARDFGDSNRNLVSPGSIR